ncbi:MAG: GMC oxidoreductase [Steroidobacteraceae bacterium]
MRRPNLVVRTSTAVRRIAFAGAGRAVEYLERGRPRLAYAAREVLLSAGAIGSPQLLLCSLPACGVDAGCSTLERARPARCRRELQDHLDVCTLYKSLRPVTYDFGPLQELLVGLLAIATRSGPGVSNVAEAGGFVRSALAADSRPDVQLHFVPAQLDDHGRNRLPGHGFTIHACALRPASRGRILLRSPDASVPPRIEARYLTGGDDLEVLLEGVRISRDIVADAAFTELRGDELFPGPRARDRSAIVEFIRRKAETIYHPVGTCRMGSADDADAVVDPALRVRGLEGLRVVDASVMPTLISGNTNAPTIMIAEKAAQVILEFERAARAADAARARRRSAAPASAPRACSRWRSWRRRRPRSHSCRASMPRPAPRHPCSRSSSTRPSRGA